MCMLRLGIYCWTRINRALRKPVQWEINMTQGQLFLYKLLPKKGKKSQPNSHVNFFSYISLISHDLLSPSCKMQQCNMECLMIIFIILMLQASQTWLGLQEDLSNFSSHTFSIVYYRFLSFLEQGCYRYRMKLSC